MLYYELSTKFDGVPVEELLVILTKVDAYFKRKHPQAEAATLRSVAKEEGALHNRCDIEVLYRENGKLLLQKLLILNDEVIDGEEFHKRYKEFY